jgi:hypothetical protein
VKHDSIEGQEAEVATHPKIHIPPIVPATPEELARRRALFAEIDRIREQIGPIGMNVVDLIDADFYELDADSE